MKIPRLTDVNQDIRKNIISFEGLNRSDMITDNQIKEGKNLSLDDFPKIKPRGSRETVKSLSDPRDYYIFDDRRLEIDGTNFYVDGLLKGQVSVGLKSIVDFNGYFVIFPDKKYYCYDTLNDEYDTFSSFTAPDIDYTAVHSNRIFGVKGSDIRACALGNFKEWETFSGDELDSWAVDVYSPGDFIGIIEYQNHITMFKRGTIYELYGTIPSNFRVQQIVDIGCIDGRTIKEVNGSLYFVGEKGVYVYNGGLPRPISQAVGNNFISGSAGTDYRKYYLSWKDLSESVRLDIYDTWLGKWIPEDDLDVIRFAHSENIEALAADGRIIRFNSGTEMVEWEFETRIFDESTFLKKVMDRINVKAEITPGARLEIYMRINNGDYKLIKAANKSKLNDILIKTKITRTQHYQLKFKGKGHVKIHHIERIFGVGSDQ